MEIHFKKKDLEFIFDNQENHSEIVTYLFKKSKVWKQERPLESAIISISKWHPKLYSVRMGLSSFNTSGISIELNSNVYMYTENDFPKKFDFDPLASMIADRLNPSLKSVIFVMPIFKNRENIQELFIEM